jgi:DNA-binding XRE family transcriptional regulator
MARSKEELNRRKARAKVWLDFRKENLLSQTALASILEMSRRMIQYIEAGTVTPNKDIQERFSALMRKYQKEKAREKANA